MAANQALVYTAFIFVHKGAGLSARSAGKSDQAGVDGIHAYIDAGIPPPNAPITLTGGWMRNPASGKAVKVKGKSGTKTMVDTGQLYNDFDWEITGKNSRLSCVSESLFH